MIVITNYLPDEGGRAGNHSSVVLEAGSRLSRRPAGREGEPPPARHSSRQEKWRLHHRRDTALFLSKFLNYSIFMTIFHDVNKSLIHQKKYKYLLALFSSFSRIMRVKEIFFRPINSSLDRLTQPAYYFKNHYFKLPYHMYYNEKSSYLRHRQYI